jgi:hypothetical protein
MTAILLLLAVGVTCLLLGAVFGVLWGPALRRRLSSAGQEQPPSLAQRLRYVPLDPKTLAPVAVPPPETPGKRSKPNRRR